jgi:hypothetical protein
MIVAARTSPKGNPLMTPIKRLAAAGSTAALLAFSLTACGGDASTDASQKSSAPTDASTDDFCEAFNSSTDVFADIDPEGEPSEQAGEAVDAFKEYADKLEKVGTPDGISDDEREGFEIIVEELGDLDEGEVEKYLEDPSGEDIAQVSEDDEKKVDAFTAYAGEECAAPETPTE